MSIATTMEFYLSSKIIIVPLARIKFREKAINRKLIR